MDFLANSEAETEKKTLKTSQEDHGFSGEPIFSLEAIHLRTFSYRFTDGSTDGSEGRDLGSVVAPEAAVDGSCDFVCEPRGSQGSGQSKRLRTFRVATSVANSFLNVGPYFFRSKVMVLIVQ